MNKFFEKARWVFENPGTCIKNLFENDHTAGFMIGLIMSGFFLVMYSSSPMAHQFQPIYAIITCIAFPFVMALFYYAMPTREELDGITPKRMTTTIFHWLAAIIIIAAIAIAFLFIHFSSLLPS